MITSMDPLRIYVFEGDVLLRFCPEKYHPFDAANRDKYVVHDDYRPTWKVCNIINVDVLTLLPAVQINVAKSYV